MLRKLFSTIMLALLTAAIYADNIEWVDDNWPIIPGYTIAEVDYLPGVTDGESYPCRILGRVANKYIAVPLSERLIQRTPYSDNIDPNSKLKLRDNIYLVDAVAKSEADKKDPSYDRKRWKDFWGTPIFMNRAVFSGLNQDIIKLNNYSREKINIIANQNPVNGVMVAMQPSVWITGATSMCVRIFGDKGNTLSNDKDMLAFTFYGTIDKNGTDVIDWIYQSTMKLDGPYYPVSADYVNLVNYGAPDNTAWAIIAKCSDKPDTMEVKYVGNMIAEGSSSSVEYKISFSNMRPTKAQRNISYHSGDTWHPKGVLNYAKIVNYSQGSMVFTCSNGNLYYYLSGLDFEYRLDPIGRAHTCDTRYSAIVHGWKLMYDKNAQNGAKLYLDNSLYTAADRRFIYGGFDYAADILPEKHNAVAWSCYTRMPNPATIYYWTETHGMTLHPTGPSNTNYYWIDMHERVASLGFPHIIEPAKLKDSPPATVNYNTSRITDADKAHKDARTEAAKDGRKVLAIVYGSPYWAVTDEKINNIPKITYSASDWKLTSNTKSENGYLTWGMSQEVHGSYSIASGSASLGFESTRGWAKTESESAKYTVSKIPEWSWNFSQNDTQEQYRGYVYWTGSSTYKVNYIVGLKKNREGKADMSYSVQGYNVGNKPAELMVMCPYPIPFINAEKFTPNSTAFDIRDPQLKWGHTPSDRLYYSALTDGIAPFSKNTRRVCLLTDKTNATEQYKQLDKHNAEIWKWQDENYIFTSLIDKVNKYNTGIYGFGLPDIGTNIPGYKMQVKSGYATTESFKTEKWGSKETSKSWSNSLSASLTVGIDFAKCGTSRTATLSTGIGGSETKLTSTGKEEELKIAAESDTKVLCGYTTEVYFLYIVIDQVKSDQKERPSWIPKYCWETNNNYLMIFPYVQKNTFPQMKR